MKTISLYPNPKRDENFSCTRHLIGLLGELGNPVLLSQELEACFSEEKEKITFVPEDELFTKGDALIPLGGDGTILSVASRAAKAGIPVLGINLGNIGFMAGLEKEDLDRLHLLKPEDFTISERMMLSCRVGEGKTFYALNEIVISSEKGFHIVELDLKASGRELTNFRADGLIFNTPTGSTGHAFSAGGAVIDAKLDSIGVKAITSYMLINAHHMLFCPETKFSAENIRTAGGRATVCADGKEIAFLKETDTVSVARADRRLKLCFLGEKSNLEVFFRKF